VFYLYKIPTELKEFLATLSTIISTEWRLSWSVEPLGPLSADEVEGTGFMAKQFTQPLDAPLHSGDNSSYWVCFQVWHQEHSISND
jgi:hypothetical protein